MLSFHCTLEIFNFKSADQDIKVAEKNRRKMVSALEKEANTILNKMAAAVYRRFIR